MSKCFPRRQLSDALGVRMGCHMTFTFFFTNGIKKAKLFENVLKITLSFIENKNI